MFDADLAAAVQAMTAWAAEVSDAALERPWTWRGIEADVRWGVYRTYEALRVLAAEIAAERAAAGRPLTVAQHGLALYHVAYRDLQAVLRCAGSERFDTVPAEGEWPLRAVTGHLLRSERHFIAVLRYAVERRADPASPAAMPREAVEQALAATVEANAEDGSLEAVLARYDALHERVLESFAGLDTAGLDAVFSWWFESDVRLQLFRYDAHLREHTIQAEKVVEAVAPRPSDALRTVRLIAPALGEAEGTTIGAPDAGAPLRTRLAGEIVARTAELAAITGG